MSSQVIEAGVTPGFKICNRCGEEKPATLAYFYRRPDTKDGLRANCKICKKVKSKREVETSTYLTHPDGYALIPLSGERGAGKFALVDMEDVEVVIKYRWNLTKAGYVRSSAAQKYAGTGLIHRLIMGNPPGLDIDHKEPAERLDNRRSNIRVATRTQNLHNMRPRVGASRFKGVGWRKQDNCWAANIRIDGQLHHLGGFHSEEEVAKVYEEAARYHFGEFALTNFVGSEKASVEEIRGRFTSLYTSAYRGIHYRHGKYQASVFVDGSKVYLGRFPSDLEAAKARDAYIRKNGLSHKLNFPKANEPA